MLLNNAVGKTEMVAPEFIPGKMIVQQHLNTVDMADLKNITASLQTIF